VLRSLLRHPLHILRPVKDRADLPAALDDHGGVEFSRRYVILSHLLEAVIAAGSPPRTRGVEAAGRGGVGTGALGHWSKGSCRASGLSMATQLIVVSLEAKTAARQETRREMDFAGPAWNGVIHFVRLAAIVPDNSASRLVLLQWHDRTVA
jgi:hypothetical protein